MEIPPKSEVGGNCEACARLFTTPGIREYVEPAVKEMARTIADEITVLDAIGLLNPASLHSLWASDGVISDDGMASGNVRRRLPLFPA